MTGSRQRRPNRRLSPIPPLLTRKDFASDQEVRWCPGCGDYSILAQMKKVLPDLGVPKENIVFISGIGCSSRFPYYMNTYGFHTIHGRAPTIATGLKAPRPDLKVWVITGDGDALSIGGNHLIHAMRRNVDLKIVLFNNQIYGLTKGQYSPTSELGKQTKSTPYGTIDYPISRCRIALAAEATFVARSVDTDIKHLQRRSRRPAPQGPGVRRGLPELQHLQRRRLRDFTDREVREDRMLDLEHGKPLIFGKDRDKGIRLNGRPDAQRPARAGDGERGAGDLEEAAQLRRDLDGRVAPREESCGDLPGLRFGNFPGDDTCANCGADLWNADTPQPVDDLPRQAPGPAPRRAGRARPEPDRRRGAGVDDAIARMQAEGIDCLLVTESDALVGIFTDRDAILKVAGQATAAARRRGHDPRPGDPPERRSGRRRDPQDGGRRVPPRADRRRAACRWASSRRGTSSGTSRRALSDPGAGAAPGVAPPVVVLADDLIWATRLADAVTPWPAAEPRRRLADLDGSSATVGACSSSST